MKGSYVASQPRYDSIWRHGPCLVDHVNDSFVSLTNFSQRVYKAQEIHQKRIGISIIYEERGSAIGQKGTTTSEDDHNKQ